ncbi:hypothetical protein D3C86_925730 [compost metagenome]
MLTEQESREFLALLLGFQLATHASGRQLGALFQVSFKTMCRWLIAAREQEAIRLIHCRTDHIRSAVEKMNALDTTEGVYATIVRHAQADAKLAALHGLKARTETAN